MALLSSLLGSDIDAYTGITATTYNPWQYYAQQYQRAIPSYLISSSSASVSCPAPEPAKASEPDEFAWLRKRVSEFLWKG